MQKDFEERKKKKKGKRPRHPSLCRPQVDIPGRFLQVVVAAALPVRSVTGCAGRPANSSATPVQPRSGARRCPPPSTASACSLAILQAQSPTNTSGPQVPAGQGQSFLQLRDFVTLCLGLLGHLSSLAGSGARDSHIKAATRWSPTTDTEEPRDSQLDASRRQGDGIVALNVFLGCPWAESVWRGSGAGVCTTRKAMGHRCPHSRGLGLSRLWESQSMKCLPKTGLASPGSGESACQTPRAVLAKRSVFSWLTGCVWGGRGGASGRRLILWQHTICGRGHPWASLLPGHVGIHSTDHCLHRV